MAAVTNEDYFAARAADTRRLSHCAKDRWVRAIHRELAWRYEQLADTTSLSSNGMLAGRDPELPPIIA